MWVISGESQFVKPFQHQNLSQNTETLLIL